MRAAERDVLLFILAVSAGSADGWSYLGLGHSFVANMTGNTVLLGISIFEKNRDLLHPFLALVGYAAGVAIASFITRGTRPGTVWSNSITWTLAVEACILAAAEAGWIALQRPHLCKGSPPLCQNLLLASVALAIGLQSGAMLQLKIPGIVTTYITGTWTTLMNGLVRLFTKVRAQTPPQEIQFEERLWMQSSILVIYFLSALLTGWFFRYLPQAVGVLPASCVLSVSGYGFFCCRDPLR